MKTNGEGDLHRRIALSVVVSARLYSCCWLACPSQINAAVEYVLCTARYAQWPVERNQWFVYA